MPGIDPRSWLSPPPVQALGEAGRRPARAASCRSSWRAALAASSSRRRAVTCWRPPRWQKASVFHDKMGQLIASPRSARGGRGLQGNAWGSINVDDEGMATQHTSSSGRRADRLPGGQNGGPSTGYARTGSGRRESYKFAPPPACTNTYIEPGNYSLDDMLATVEHGIYAKRMGAALCSRYRRVQLPACGRPTSSRAGSPGPSSRPP